jgi:protein-S-isoprenylcysteine O-methyltransferase Ste14
MIRTRLLDLFEQVVVAVLFCFLIARLWPDEFSPSQWYPLLILLSEGIVAFFLLIRRGTEKISTRAQDWLIAFGGTLFPLLVIKGSDPLSADIGLVLMLSGLYIHLGAKLSLRRSFGLVAADRGIKARGLYASVRHPMYIGYITTHIGYLLVAPTWWNLTVYLAAWTLLVMRIFAEERLLLRNPEYQEYSTRVRYRLIPLVF